MTTTVQNLSIRLGLEGPQLILEWTNPTDGAFVDVMVRRALVDWPSDETQGDLIYQGTNEAVSDLAVDGGTPYYYTVFARIGAVWGFDEFSKISAVAFDNSDYPLRLWERLSELYRQMDATTDQKVLTAQVDGVEEFNFDEDQLASYGQLKRFLKIFGMEFGLIREQMAYFQEFYDPWTVWSKFLPLVAFLVGLKLPSGVGLARQRFLLATAVESYKIRGTTSGLARFLAANFGSEALLTEFRNNVIMSNDVNRVSVNFAPEVLALIGTPWDVTDRVIDFKPWPSGTDGMWTFRGLGIWLELADKDLITQAMIDTAIDFLADFLGATVQWFLFYRWDDGFVEEFSDLTAWTYTEPAPPHDPGFLAVVNGEAVFDNTIPPGLSPWTATLVKNTPVTVGAPTDFEFTTEFKDIEWSQGVADPAEQNRIMVMLKDPSTAAWTRVMFYRLPSAGNPVIVVDKQDAAGYAALATLNVADFTDIIFKIERRGNDMIYSAQIDGVVVPLAVYTPLAPQRLIIATQFDITVYYVVYGAGVLGFKAATPVTSLMIDSTQTGWVQVHP